MITRAVLLLSFGFVAAAEARETAALRIGSHDGFVRVVIECPSRRSFTNSILPGGRQSVIETAAELTLARPKAKAPVSAVTDTVRDRQGTQITLTFDAPMTLVREMNLPSLTEKGYRHVFDFAPAEAGVASNHHDAADPRQPEATLQALGKPNGSLAAILQTVQLGLADPEIRHAIATEYGPTESLIRMSYKTFEGETGVLLTHRIEFDDIGSVQVTYRFSSRSERLNEVDIDWGSTGGAPLSDENAHLIVTRLYRELQASGFSVVGPKGDADMSDEATILLADGKIAGRQAMLSWTPLAQRSPQQSTPAVRLSLVSRSGEQTGSPRH